MPGSPALPALDDDDRFRAFAAFTHDARAFLADRAWDNLAHIERFAQASSLAKELLADYPGATERRRMAHALYALLPEAARAKPFLPFVDEVAARAPEFRIRSGDVPKVAPSYNAFLADPEIVGELVRAGAGPLLAPRSVCPGAAPRASASCIALYVDHVGAGAVGTNTVRGHVMNAKGAQHERIGPDGAPLLTVDGKTQPILVPLDVVTAWLFSAGPDARGLDLRSEDDRALLLAYAHELRRASVRGRSAFAWLEDNGTPLDVRVEVVGACVQAAVDVVARFSLDALACRITLRADGGDGAWQAKAAAALDDTGLFRDVVTRASGPVTTSSSTPAVSSPVARDIVWADAILPHGFAAGRLSAVAAGRAFARLSTSMLAPLGVLPLSGLKDASGAVVLQRIIPVDAPPASHGPSSPPTSGTSAPPTSGIGAVDDAASRVPRVRLEQLYVDGARIRPLAEAWAAGDGLALPDPKGAPRHDVSAMPAWLAFFLEGLA